MDTPNATYAGPLAVRRGPTAWAATAGHGDHADRDAVLWLPRRAAPHRRLPRVPGSAAASSARSPRTTRSATSSDAGLLAPVLARHLGGRPGRPADTGLRDLRAGGRYLLCSGGLSPAVDDRPLRNVLILRPHQPTRRRMAARAGEPGQRVPVDPRTAVQGPACGANRLPAPTARRGCAPADQPRYAGTARRPAARPPPPSCPMCPGVLAYHRRDNVPGQIRAQIRPPGPSAKITQGARPLQQEPTMQPNTVNTHQTRHGAAGSGRAAGGSGPGPGRGAHPAATRPPPRKRRRPRTS